MCLAPCLGVAAILVATLPTGALARRPLASEQPRDADQLASSCVGLETALRGERVAAALAGALVADALAAGTDSVYDLEVIKATYAGVAPKDFLDVSARKGSPLVAGDQTESGDELLFALDVVSVSGFELGSFAASWRRWAESYAGFQGPAVRETLQNVAAGAPAEAAGSHYIELRGAVRAPALLLLAERVDDEGLALASREAILVSHENPRALQAGEFLMRAALQLLLRRECPGSRAERRHAVVDALRGAADRSGAQFNSIIDEALSEAQSREAFAKVGAGFQDAFAAIRGDVEVVGRMTASGSEMGQEVQGGKTSYIIPAIVWLVVAYDSFAEAAVANALFGGESGVRAIFVGLLLAARDGESAVPAAWRDQLAAKLPMGCRAPPFVQPLRLCEVPGACHSGDGWAGELNMYGVAVAAALVSRASGPPNGGPHWEYRVFVRLDATMILYGGGTSRPSDWDEEEDGVWEPPPNDPTSGRVACLARYFQFTGASGRHAPFSVWPLEAMCELTLEQPIAHESFDLLMSEPLTDVIGGAVVGDKGRIVKLPRLQVAANAEAPGWSEHCTHIGTINLRDGKWLELGSGASKDGIA